MANTFKVFSIADVAVDSGTFSTLYTVAGSTTGIILGMNICNKIATERDVTVKLTSDTGNRTGANNAANESVSLLNEVTIPAYEGQMGILKDHIPLITFLLFCSCTHPSGVIVCMLVPIIKS